MNLTIQLEAQLRQLADAAAIEVAAEDNSTLQDVIRAASAENTELAEALLAKDGSVSRSVLVFVNDVPTADSSMQLNDGDTILLLPPISGG